MGKNKKMLVGLLSLSFAVSLSGGLFASVSAYADTPATVMDNADQIGGEGAVTADIYGLALQSGDVGFGTDGRYVTSQAPTAAPTASTWWEAYYGYAQYTLSGQNAVTVTVDVDPTVKDKLSPVFCYVQGIGALEVSDTAVQTSENWTRITYTYEISDPAKAEWLRVIPSAYSDTANGLETWQQQITKVEISYVETLPEKDPVVTPDPEPETPVEVVKIEDACGALDNSVSADIYGMTLQSGDVGFGEDGRYTTTKAPETAPTTDTMWNAEYGYVQYNVAGQNLLTVVADIPAEVLTKMPHPVVYEKYSDADGGKVLQLNNYSVETSSNWSRVTYKYILDANISWVRILIGAYNAWDSSVFTWQQQITSVTIEKMEALPEKDADIPIIELAPEKTETPEEPVDEATLKTIYTDVCNGNLIEGLRADVYNVDVKGDKSALIGDGDRIVFGGNPGASESYIEYKMAYMDTIAVTTYEEIGENNTRPEGATQIKFAVWLNGTCVAWEVEATKIEVETGDSASGRWSKIVWYYQLEEAIENAKIRVMIAKPAEGQVENQLGRVDIYNSGYADLAKLVAKQEVERYSFLKGQTNYETESWNALQEIMVVALTDLDNAEGAEAIEQILTKAKADMNAIKTSAQEFEETKALKKQEIADYATEKGQDNYTEEAWTEIMGYVTEAQVKIDAATGMSQINVAILDAKDAIDQVETKPVESQPGESADQSGLTSVEDGNGDDSSTDLGCFGSAFSLAIVAPVALGAAAIVLKKKED